MAREVLCIHQNFIGPGQAGNARATQIFSRLAERGATVHVVTSHAGYFEDRADEPGGPVVERRGRLIVHRLPLGLAGPQTTNRGRAYLAFGAAAGRYLRRIGRVDAVYATSPPLPQVILSAASAWRRRVPMVFEVRDLWPAFLADVGLIRSRPMLAALEWVEAFGYRYADHLLPVSPPFADYLQAMGVPPDRITVAPTGMDAAWLDRPGETGRAWRRRLGLGDRFLVLYTGSFSEHYGMELILSAAERLAPRHPEVQWVFAGAGRDRRRVEQAADRLGFVTYLGSVAKDDLAGAYLAADAALVSLIDAPLMETVIPGKLLDYFAASLPVVSLVGGLPGLLVRQAGAGAVVPAYTAEALAEAVADLAETPVERREAMGRRGRQWAARHLSAETTADAVAACLLAGRRRPSRAAASARLLRAAAGATRDVVSGRSARAVEALFADRRQETLRGSFQRWLAEPAARPASINTTP